MKAIFPIIQILSSVWSKKSRGNPGATIRNAVPDSVELPTDFLSVPTGNFYIHEQKYAEWSDFEPNSNCWSQKDGATFKFDCIEIVIGGNKEFIIKYCHKPEIAGRPIRPQSSHEIEALSLSLGQIGRLRYNGRFEDFDTGEWYYRKIVFNIAIKIKKNGLDLFIRDEPDKRFDDMADLF